MTDWRTESGGSLEGTNAARQGSGGLPRWVQPMAAVITIIPIWVAVIRAGIQQVPAIGDAALTVLRARDVFSAHPPLVGMLAAGASGTGYNVHFPGAWQLYALAVPTRLLGDVWGPVVAMGALNTIWVLLACWLLCRRLHTTQSLLGIGFLALWLWSIGSGFLITPVPMDMVLIPFVTFLIAVWCVAAGDLVALPVLAAVANFLWLSHLVLVLLVPVIGLCAVVGLVLWLRRQRRAKSLRAVLGDARWPLITTAVITVVMWLPSLVQQFTTNPGNLRLLLASSGDSRSSVGSWTTAAHMVIETITRPPFWFRGTVDAPSYSRSPIGPSVFGALTLFDVLAAIAMTGAVIALLFAAYRRRDRIGSWALMVAVVAVLASLPNVYLAPTTVGFPVNYLRSLQGVAMFVWFAVTLNVVRLIEKRITTTVGWAFLAAIAVLGVLNIPQANQGYGADERASRLVRNMNATVAPKLGGDGQVLVQPAWDLVSQSYFTALALDLADRGIDFCLPPAMVRQIGRACPSRPNDTVFIAAQDNDAPPSGVVLWSSHKLDRSERAELARLDQRWTRWLKGIDRLELTDDAADFVRRSTTSDVVRNLDAMLAPADGDLTGAQDQRLFQLLVEYSIQTKGGRGVSPFVDSSLSGDELVRWSRLKHQNQTLFVTERRHS